MFSYWAWGWIRTNISNPYHDGSTSYLLSHMHYFCGLSRNRTCVYGVTGIEIILLLTSLVQNAFFHYVILPLNYQTIKNGLLPLIYFGFCIIETVKDFPLTTIRNTVWKEPFSDLLHYVVALPTSSSICFVERKGFEPLTPALQKRCSSQTELTPHLESELSFLVIRLLNLLQFFISYIMTVIY